MGKSEREQALQTLLNQTNDVAFWSSSKYCRLLQDTIHKFDSILEENEEIKNNSYYELGKLGKYRIIKYSSLINELEKTIYKLQKQVERLENEKYEVQNENYKLFKEIATFQNKNTCSVIGNFRYIDKELLTTNKALEDACYLALKNNCCIDYLIIDEGLRSQYNMPITKDIITNKKLLKEYLLAKNNKN